TVFVFGGSTTFGYRIADDETIPSHLQQWIRKEIDPSATVYNFGRGSYFATQERVLFEKLVVQGYVPNMVIFIDGLNDFAIPEGEPAHTAALKKLMDEGDKSSWDRLVRELPVTKFLFSVTSKNQDGVRNNGTEDSTQDVETTAKKIIQRYRTDKKIIVSVAAAFGIKPVFVWQPVPIYEYDQQYNIFRSVDFGKRGPLLQLGYKLMAAEYESGALGDDFVWCAGIQKDAKSPLYVDAVHYSGEMADMIAKCIVTNIKQKGISGNKKPVSFSVPGTYPAGDPSAQVPTRPETRP
ncbi:MAG TPA: SGNH/GDSL hydrolase family protein, partial [Desulfomonilaceae bacterium]|nr:SGNH/GDSL hydrolase family protein [Desulfomonilaceae bacterium]